MDTSNIKKYAPKARVAFQQAVKAKANSLGISESNIEVATQSGDFLMVADRTFPASIKKSRDLLVREVELKGFEYVIEHVASTWFNRFCAIRFMELQGYLEHGYRVLSHPTEENSFEILSFAADVADDFSLDREQLLDLSLAGNKEEEIYRQLILGQCHILHQAMEFLFEKIDGTYELLLPDGLTRTDSIIRDLVNDIPEDDWQNVEIIGWLYQFYISEKKDEVIGKVVKSEDIPAATQLFTPNWIVQYLVQNSVGRQWLQTYPESPIKAEMPYYIEPAKQSDEVNKQLAEITPSSLDPETIKVLDPACGSGHILVEAYKTLKAIYTDRSYKPRDIPKLILEKNLYGLDIDDRAAQLAGFALMMMARADDRRIFTRGVKLNILSLQETTNLDIDSLWQQLGLNSQSEIGSNDDMFAVAEQGSDYTDTNYQLLIKCKEWFLQAKTLGSLIDVPESYHEQLKQLSLTLSGINENGTNTQKDATKIIYPIIQQALLLSQQYDAVIANPPYMGAKFYTNELKSFINLNFKQYRADLYSVFLFQNLKLSKINSYVAMITIPNWMFLGSFEELRKEILSFSCIDSLIHNGRGVWGSDFGSCAFVMKNSKLPYHQGVFKKLFTKQGSVASNNELMERFFSNKTFNASSNELKKINGYPISFWASHETRSLYKNKKIGDNFDVREGLGTRDDDLFLRRFWEVSKQKFRSSEGNEKWIKTDKAGAFRKWYGNADFVMNWDNDGYAIKNHRNPDGSLKSRPQNTQYFFKKAISWNKVGIGITSFRFRDKTWGFNDAAPSIFGDNVERILPMLVSKVFKHLLEIQGNTVNVTTGIIKGLPNLGVDGSMQTFKSCVDITKNDWDSFEVSWDFKKLQLLQYCKSNIKESYSHYKYRAEAQTEELHDLEERNNKTYIESWGLTKELNPSVPIKEISLMVNPYFRYPTLTSMHEERFQSDSFSELISYSIGCMMGRYSLDRDGLVYAHAGNKGFDDLVTDNAYQSFPADDDGIVPLTDMEWFPDDATYRFRDFVKAVWGEDNLQENLDFVAESLCLHTLKPKRGESSLVTIRRYMSNQFFKDHLKTYKKRPIYWLFSSGKQKAFECLVYLHRYNEGSLARMRTQYVTPLIGKYQARIGQLEQKLENASTSEKTKLTKEITQLEKKLVELRAFDDNLKHYADMRISIDLDDGVKVNYGKFGSLLAEVKAVHGKAVK